MPVKAAVKIQSKSLLELAMSYIQGKEAYTELQKEYTAIGSRLVKINQDNVNLSKSMAQLVEAGSTPIKIGNKLLVLTKPTDSPALNTQLIDLTNMVKSPEELVK